MQNQLNYDPRNKWKFRRLSLKDKFNYRIISKDGCWQWDMPNTKTGYGFLCSGGKHHLAHRLSYELHKGPIPEGMQIDHICRNRACVNPDHLRIVTSRENTLCGENISAKRAKQTHCNRGHEFTKENTYLYGKHKRNRMCRQCIDLRKQWYKKK